jgi:hypothetical protein
MILGFVEMDGDTFYGDIWPRIKDDVEILESIRDGAKKGVCPVIIKWGYKDDTKEKIILAISRLDGTEEKHWVVPTLIQRV